MLENSASEMYSMSAVTRIAQGRLWQDLSGWETPLFAMYEAGERQEACAGRYPCHHVDILEDDGRCSFLTNGVSRPNRTDSADYAAISSTLVGRESGQ